MAEFIGGFGGLLMIALIVILFFRFLVDIGVDKNRIYRKQIAGFALPALLLALLQLIYGALFSSFVNGSVSVFDINSIWTMKPVSETHNLVASYSFSYTTGLGIMPLYYVLTGAFAGILYDMYDQCSLYISMLSGIITYVSLGLVIERSNAETEDGDKRTKQMFTMLLCLPGSVFLFLPSGLSLGLAFLGVFLLVWNGGNGNKVVSLILAILCCITHLVGICAVAVYVAGCILKFDAGWAHIRDLAVISIGQLMVIIICGVNGWGSLPEYLLIYAVVVILGINNLKIRMSHAVVTVVNLMMILVSGFWITGALYGVM